MFRWLCVLTLALPLFACEGDDDDGEDEDDDTDTDGSGDSGGGGGSGGSGESYDPQIVAEDFVDGVDHPLFPLPVGMTWHYESETDEGTETIDVEVLAETKEILGITCTVVRDTARLDGEVIEDTHDWYAQDQDGSVWYMGEATEEFEDGEVDTAGSWEAGVDGAKPGIIMQAEPEVGQRYRQEYYAGEAEDFGEVVGLDQAVEVRGQMFAGCLKTRDTNPLEPDVEEFKYYCPDVGLVLAEHTAPDTQREELVSFERP